MDCEDCAKKIKLALLKIQGVKSLQIDVPTNTAVIQMERHIGADELNSALKGTNFILQDERMVQAGGTDVQKNSFKNFLPLIFIFGVIFALTAGVLIYDGRWDIMNAMRIFEGIFFIVFGGFKLLNWRGFVNAYETYDLIASKSRLYGYSYPILEILLGVGYIAGYNLPAVNIATIILMSISALGVFRALMDKRRVQCACLGVVFKIPMTKITLFEDVLMIIMALAMLLWAHLV